MDGGWSYRTDQRLSEIDGAGRRRTPRVFDATGQVGELEGHEDVVCAFASNDYLGLSHHKAVVEAAREAANRFGVGSGASRLITGSRAVHRALEEEVAAWKGTERSMLFPTGYQANLGVLSTFGEADVLICSDELNHASIIDGCRLSRSSVAVYPHRDMQRLEALLASHQGRSLVVTDLVFSMDGHFAPLEEIACLCRRYGALLVLDEAHYVLGPDPAPLLDGIQVMRVSTLSKTLGSQGGVVAGPSSLVELLENVARSYIFSTALAPPLVAGALEALRVLRSPEGDRLRGMLAGNVEALVPSGRDGDGRIAQDQTQIVPVIVGSEADAMEASSTLLSMGMWVPAIRPPTVPPGTSRLRISLSADHTRDQVGMLRNALEKMGLGL